jgi:hypothetical protein
MNNTGGQIFNIPLAAGQTLTQPGAGTRAYLALATAPVNMRARGKLYGQDAYSLFTVGQGIMDTHPDAVPFDVVDIQNLNNIPVVISIWIGFSMFIDNRLILANQQVPNVVNPIYVGTGVPPAFVDIPDLSGGPFADINGKNWLAITRLQLLITNLDAGNVQMLQKFGNHVFNTGAIFAIQPATEIGLALSGDYSLTQNSGVINGLVSEVYQAIPA